VLDYFCTEALLKFFGVTTTGNRVKYFVVDGDVFDPRYAKFNTYQDTIILRRSNATDARRSVFGSVNPVSAAAMLGLMYVELDNSELSASQLGSTRRDRSGGSIRSSMTSSGFSSIKSVSLGSEGTPSEHADTSMSVRRGYIRRPLFPSQKHFQKRSRRPTISDWQSSVNVDMRQS